MGSNGILDPFTKTSSWRESITSHHQTQTFWSLSGPPPYSFPSVNTVDVFGTGCGAQMPAVNALVKFTKGTVNAHTTCPRAKNTNNAGCTNRLGLQLLFGQKITDTTKAHDNSKVPLFFGLTLKHSLQNGSFTAANWTAGGGST